KIAIKGDATARAIYHHDNIDVSIGYNLYGNSREEICHLSPRSACQSFDESKHFGFKGCTGTDFYTYTTNNTGTTIISATTSTQGLSLNATASDTTISNCGSVDGNTAGFEFLDNSTHTVGVDWSNAVQTNNPAPASRLTPGTAVADVVITRFSN